MKKYLLLLSLVTLPFISRSQALSSAWYDYVNSFSLAQLNGGFDLATNRFNFLVFPDTTTKIIYVNTNTGGPDPQYNNWCSWGTAFDPTDSVFSLDGDTIDAVPSKNPYSVDSVAYFYTYQRRTDASVVDTLILQSKKLNNFFILSDNTTHQIIQRVGTVDFDIKTGVAAKMDATVKIPLTISDTSVTTFRALTKELNIKCAPGEFVVTTLTFKPGVAYSKNDTIQDFYPNDLAAGKPGKKMNAFGLLIDEDVNGTQNRCLRPNNGMVVNKQQRYLPTWFQSSSYGPQYIIATGFGQNGSISFYPRTNYKVSTYAVTSGINKAMKDGYALGNIYPNPANGNATIQFTLGQSGNTSLEIFDIMGRKVMTAISGMYTSGTHYVNINTEGMKPGVYFYTINTDGFTQTKKFTVAE